MSIKPLLKGWTIPRLRSEVHIRRYSTTGDILSYKRCRRQYGFFSVRGFATSVAAQLYFGTLVHDVLDRINRDYRQDVPLPDMPRIVQLVSEAHDRLIRTGIRTYSARQQQEQAMKLIYRLVRILGPGLFPNIRETEYHLERALKTHEGRDYILHGIVDVLSGAVCHALQLPFSTESDDVEIWDYKSGEMPSKDSQMLRDYEYQLRVYAELYRQQTGSYPARSALVFVGELDDDRRWNEAHPDVREYPTLIYTSHPQSKRIQDAMLDFHQTVEAIERERKKPYAQQWLPPDPATHEVDQKTCEGCDLRFNCSYHLAKYDTRGRQRAEPL